MPDRDLKHRKPYAYKKTRSCNLVDCSQQRAGAGGPSIYDALYARRRLGVPGTGRHFVLDQPLWPRSRPNGKFIAPSGDPPGAFVGVVEAPDETSALKAAIEEFGIV